jgi:hypothetical protein
MCRDHKEREGEFILWIQIKLLNFSFRGKFSFSLHPQKTIENSFSPKSHCILQEGKKIQSILLKSLFPFFLSFQFPHGFFRLFFLL